MEILFWTSFAILGWCYLGYPAGMWFLSVLRPRSVRSTDAPRDQRVSVVLAVRNGEEYLDRRLAVALMAEPSVTGVELDRTGLTVRAGDYGAFTRALPRIALASGIRVRRLLPSDESLESVFSYLVEA